VTLCPLKSVNPLIKEKAMSLFDGLKKIEVKKEILDNQNLKEKIRIIDIEEEDIEKDIEEEDDPEDEIEWGKEEFDPEDEDSELDDSEIDLTSIFGE
jgi:hypothetical protein